MSSTHHAPRYLTPGRVTTGLVNPLVAWLTRHGLPLKGSAVLEVAGRVSGETRATPVNPLVSDATTYLVAPRGETQWVRNIRQAGGGALVRGRSRREIAVTELADAAKPAIIRAYLRAWAWEVGKFFPGLSAQSSDDEIAAVAAGFPVFRID